MEGSFEGEKNQLFSRELREILKEKGAGLVGYADLDGLTEGKWPRGVSIAVRIPKEIVSSISGGPNREYFEVYHELNARLDALALICEKYLKEKGSRAFAQTVNVVEEYGNYRTWMPHKTVATRAGLGWIGKNALLVTEEYGSAVRITSALTDAPLEAGEPVSDSRCGGCTACMRSCPAGAISGKSWRVALDRDEFVDIEACRRTARRMVADRLGEQLTLCGICISVCPYTRRYLKSE